MRVRAIDPFGGAWESEPVSIHLESAWPVDDWSSVDIAPSNFVPEAISQGGSPFLIVGRGAPPENSHPSVRWSSRTSDSEDSDGAILDLAYGDGAWVAVGLRGTLLASKDAESWALLPVGTRQSFNAVTYGNGRFIVVGTSGHVLELTDKIVSFRRIGGALNGVAYGNGKIVVVERSGAVRVRDGGSWSRHELRNDLTLNDVAFGRDTFVVVGSGGVAMVSDDGYSWTFSETGVDADLYKVHFGGGTFQAVGAAGSVVTSCDGVRWIPRRFTADRDLRGSAYAQGSWVVLPRDDVNSSNESFHGIWLTKPVSFFSRPETDENGQFRFQFNGQPSLKFLIQYSEMGNEWIDLKHVDGENSPVEVIEPTPLSSRRLYRALSQ